jgi:acyl-CoA reductase-like NAD-dependent aldehyde dehydrogenase
MAGLYPLAHSQLVNLTMPFDSIGLPKGLLSHVVLEHSQTEAIISGGHVDHVAFTGSVEGGRAMERAAAGTFTTLGLELGGKDPAYVAPDANLKFAIENLVDGAFFNSGQCCCGIERIYVHESRYEAFVKGFVELTAQYVLGDPLDQATTLGPMARASLAEVVRAQTQEAIEKGAKAHIDPKSFVHDRPGSPYLAPQVLTDVDHTMGALSRQRLARRGLPGKMADDDLVCPPPVSARDHPARGLAVCPIHAQLSRRRRSAR